MNQTTHIVSFAASLLVTGASASAQTIVYEEDFEDFEVGPFLEQSDFNSEYPERFSIIESDGIEGKSLRYSASEFALQGLELVSPAFPSVYGTLEADVRVIGSNHFSLAPIDAETDLFPAGALTGLFSGMTLEPGTTIRLTIEVRADGQTRLYKDGVLANESINAGEQFLGVPGRIGQWGLYLVDFDGPLGEGGVIIDNVRVTAFPCPEDFNADGVVDAYDLAEVLARWGDCGEYYAPCPTDRNEDGEVGTVDLANLLAAWGTCD